jgi:hypothetical protein
MSSATKAFVAGAFILGMGAGIFFDSEVTFEPGNVASTVLVDTKTPRCAREGRSVRPNPNPNPNTSAAHSIAPCSV